MSTKDVCDALKKTIDGETKVECGELVFEFYRSNNSLDLTSAILPQAQFNNELSFSAFLSSDFTDQPVVLVSKMRQSSVSEDNSDLSESTPASIKSNGTGSISSLRMRMESRKDTSTGVWGSPLKCSIPSEDESVSSLYLDTSQIPTETKKPRTKHLGIPLNLARKIISVFNINVSGEAENLPPLLVLCDGRDRHTTALMGVKPFQVSKETCTSKGMKMVTLLVDKKGGADMKIKMGGGLMQTCQAIYQVNVEGQKPCATVAVETKWKGANRLLEAPPMEASAAVKASVQPGSMMSCMSFYQELQFLERIVSALTSGQVEWISLSSDKPAVPLTTAMKDLIETLQEEGTLGSWVTQEEGEAETWTFSTVLKSFGIPERKDFDFTDRLWKVMQDCMSTADLISSLHLVFRAVGQGHLRPYVDRYNQTTVAQIVRESFLGRFSAPSLSGVQPLLFAAEMGAEKLKRDYVHILVSQSLAPPSTLEPFISPNHDLHQKLDNLWKLHSVVEMVALLGASLRLPTDTLGAVTQRMLAHYRQHPADPRHVFSFPMKTSEVRYVTGSVPPAMWSVETSSEGKVQESSLHCLSTTQPLLHLQADVCGNRGDNWEKAENSGAEMQPVSDVKGDYFLVRRQETVIIM